ncbi:MAG: Sec-independent protein translocase protein TatB [Usitatibacter sp.]
MFDIGFSELVVIGVVALVVIGPERLPKVSRTLGVLFGRLQRYVTQVKADINREMELAELGKVKSEFESAARSFQSEVQTQAALTEKEIRDATSSIERELEAKSEPQAPGAEPQAASPQMELGIEEPEPRRDKPGG